MTVNGRLLSPLHETGNRNNHIRGLYPEKAYSMKTQIDLTLFGTGMNADYILSIAFPRGYTLFMAHSDRKAGVLLHITSLPSDYGIGDLGENAYKFVDTLADSSVRLWQMLPVGPTGYGDSPYAARSAFAGNELMISPRQLYREGYLGIEDVLDKAPQSERVDYGIARALKMPMLRRAALNFMDSRKNDRKDYEAFIRKEAWWLDDYALFQVLADEYNDSRWFLSWPRELKMREEGAIRNKKEEKAEEIEVYKILQYFFYKQFMALKLYANERSVSLIGDIPIFVAGDSSDAWAKRELLKIDENGEQEASSGVPPDAFSADGQLWGNPLYRWEEHIKTGFRWWIDRFKKNLELFDIVRVDHFRGFESYWEVPKGETTAKNGKWVKSPGQQLFDALKSELGDNLPIIAEDLGVITPEVEELRVKNGFPGMKILQFAFAFEDGEWQTDNPYLPHNAEKLSVAYTGTHDNNTTKGWYDELDDGMKDYVRRYFECGDEEVLWRMIRSLMASPSMYAIFPMQDILGLGADARMNVPSTCGTSNWSWKMKTEDVSSPSFQGIKYYAHLYGRD